MIRRFSISADELVDEIAGYLSRHPRAEDTLEGIAEWWLLEQQIARQAPLVQEALAVLTDRGWVRQRKGSDGRVYYRLDPLRAGKLRASLNAPLPRRTPGEPGDGRPIE